MESEYKDFIVPVWGMNYKDGCGFFCGDYFITAGHLIQHAKDPFIFIKGKKVTLPEPIICRFDNREDGYDLAVFKMKGITSPIELSEVIPTPGTNVIVMGYQDQEIDCRFVETDAIVLEYVQGFYYTFNTTEQLKAGCSGGPVFQDGKVVGIIVMGNCGAFNEPLDKDLSTKFCVALSGKAIKEILRLNL